jgi:hypothetical protein
MTKTKPQHPDVFMQILAAALTPFFLTATEGDAAHARAAAIDTINAYAPSYPSDLLPIAQIIAFGLAALSSISLSMAENIPILLILRLRGNAASLTRGSEQCRRALAEPPLPEVEPYPSAELAEADRWIEEAVNAEIVRARQAAADDRAGDRESQSIIPQDNPPTMAAALDALAAESRRRIEEAEATLVATSPHPARPAPRPVPVAEPAARAAWANAMAEIAPGSPAFRPPSAGIRAAALASAANHLMTGGPTPSPLILKTPAA